LADLALLFHARKHLREPFTLLSGQMGSLGKGAQDPLMIRKAIGDSRKTRLSMSIPKENFGNHINPQTRPNQTDK
jgi:hypothetical protein